MVGFRSQRLRRMSGNVRGRLIIALVIAAFAVLSYFGSKEYNPITDETQYVGLTPQQEIALGLQATPQMVEQHGGLDPDKRLQDYVDQIGAGLVQNSAAKETSWQFDFHLLRDPRTINAFVLPGGQVFITKALLERLRTDGQLAGVLAHEIGHVIARHSAQRIAKQRLTEGLSGAVGVASGDYNAARMAAIVGQLVNMRYGRKDELESDRLGVRFMADAGYDPRAMVEVMKTLAEASSDGRAPEFFSTHPNPENRIQKIQQAIGERLPDGVPPGLKV